jgi:D-2-hydroxyacid dehydrogenase (NADP+)
MAAMQIDRIGVHESVSTVFPPEPLRDELVDRTEGTGGTGAPDVVVVGDDDLPDCDAVVTFEYRAAFLDHVAWVHSIQAGVDRFPFEDFEAAGVVLTNSTGIHGESVGETVTGYLLSFARRLHRSRDAQGDREWRPPAWDEAFTLAGERACVVGLGTLGRGIAEHLDAIGMTVTGVRRSGDPVEGVEEVYTPDRLQEAIGDAKFVALAVPLTPETRGSIGADELAAMPDDGYLVNVSRGDVVDQDALVAALQSGDLAGAALDVFEEEPLPAESPLWDMDEVIVSPHCAAFTRDYYRDIADLVETNLDRIAADEDLHNRVV